MDVWRCLNGFCIGRSKLVFIICRILTSSCELEEVKRLSPPQEQHNVWVKSGFEIKSSSLSLCILVLCIL